MGSALVRPRATAANTTVKWMSAGVVAAVRSGAFRPFATLGIDVAGAARSHASYPRHVFSEQPIG